MVRQAGRWLRSRQQPHVVILGYHQVRDERTDPLDLSVSAAELDSQLAFVARAARPVRLAQALGELAAGSLQPRTVVVTFDDGYDDSLSTALPLLQKHGVPATIFVTTGNPGVPFWWDALTAIVCGAPDLPPILEMGIGEHRLEFATADRSRLVRQISAKLAGIPAALRQAAIASLAARFGEPSPATPRALRLDEIAELGRNVLIDLGGHSVTHPRMADLPPDEQRRELEDNKAHLEALTGQKVGTFAYPNGSFTAGTLDVVRACGFAAACTSIPDVATVHSDALALPRFWVDGDRRRTFASWLERWL
jgi:peptidoglycan/xylan/chitin deacetylase (PgdA/CDA1 family)